MKKYSQLWWFLVILTVISGISLVGSVKANISNIPLSAFLTALDGNQIDKVTIFQETAIGAAKDGSRFKTFFPSSYSSSVIDQLHKKGAQFEFIGIDGQRTLFDRIFGVLGFILSWLPMLILTWFLLAPFINRNKDKNGGGGGMGGGMFGSNNPFTFGKSKAKAIMPGELNVKFSDVAGIDEAKEDIVEIVDFLRDPSKYHSIGGKIPRGCLLVGQPGTGKTMLAKAIAAEANVPFFFISGSDFVEMFVGVGASRVRDMFAQAKKQAPCIIFIDEIDAVGRHRGIGMGGGNDEREQTLNQMLVEMDGFQENSGVVVVAATNRPDVLDPALLRPGRFDRQIVVGLPDIKGRESILSVHAKKVKLSPDVDIHTIARGTPGFSGADLANIVNEAALLAARRNKKIVTMKEFEDAKDKVMMGSERKSMVMTEEERKLTAYHEGGHAIIAINMKDSDPIHKATIIPRGQALGMVVRLPEKDRLSMSKAKYIADIVVAMGGRIAEELIFGEDKITSGASSDIQHATRVARNMVVKYGFSKLVGHVNYSGDETDSYLGSGSKRNHDMSDETAKLIDSEVKKIIDDAYIQGKKILMEKKDDLELLAKTLLESETLTGDEIKELMETRTVNFNKSTPQSSGEPHKSRLHKIMNKEDSENNSSSSSDAKSDAQ